MLSNNIGPSIDLSLTSALQDVDLSESINWIIAEVLQIENCRAILTDMPSELSNLLLPILDVHDMCLHQICCHFTAEYNDINIQLQSNDSIGNILALTRIYHRNHLC